MDRTFHAAAERGDSHGWERGNVVAGGTCGFGVRVVPGLGL